MSETGISGRDLLNTHKARSESFAVEHENRPLSAAPIGLYRQVQKPHHAVEPAWDDLTIGHNIHFAPGTHHLEFGSQRVTLPLDRAGVYVNPPYVDVTSEQDITTELVFLSTTMAHAASLVGLEEPDLAQAIRPLHDGVILGDPLLEPLIQSMWGAAKRQGPDGSSLYVEQATQTLLLYLVNQAHGPDWGKAAFARQDAAPPAEIFGSPAMELDQARLSRALDYIDAHLADGLRLDDIAQAAATSPSTLSRTFKAATGQSVWSHVQNRRLDRAAEMLTKTGTPIAKIAYACGFSSQSHLTTAFLTRFGATPGKYREETRSGASRQDGI